METFYTHRKSFEKIFTKNTKIKKTCKELKIIFFTSYSQIYITVFL